jgi:hypothetical protein
LPSYSRWAAITNTSIHPHGPALSPCFFPTTNSTTLRFPQTCCCYGEHSRFPSF